METKITDAQVCGHKPSCNTLDEHTKRTASGEPPTAKHTPGPWRITRMNGEPMIVAGDGQHGNTTICLFAPCQMEDARLIAVSPELLAVADLAYRILGDFMGGFSVNSQADEVLMRDGHATRNAIAAAIDKATS